MNQSNKRLLMVAMKAGNQIRAAVGGVKSRQERYNIVSKIMGELSAKYPMTYTINKAKLRCQGTIGGVVVTQFEIRIQYMAGARAPYVGIKTKEE